jgi:hypothetical protein
MVCIDLQRSMMVIKELQQAAKAKFAAQKQASF